LTVQDVNEIYKLLSEGDADEEVGKLFAGGSSVKAEVSKPKTPYEGPVARGVEKQQREHAESAGQEMFPFPKREEKTKNEAAIPDGEKNESKAELETLETPKTEKRPDIAMEKHISVPEFSAKDSPVPDTSHRISPSLNERTPDEKKPEEKEFENEKGASNHPSAPKKEESLPSNEGDLKESPSAEKAEEMSEPCEKARGSAHPKGETPLIKGIGDVCEGKNTWRVVLDDSGNSVSVKTSSFELNLLRTGKNTMREKGTEMTVEGDGIVFSPEGKHAWKIGFNRKEDYVSVETDELSLNLLRGGRNSVTMHGVSFTLDGDEILFAV